MVHAARTCTKSVKSCVPSQFILGFNPVRWSRTIETNQDSAISILLSMKLSIGHWCLINTILMGNDELRFCDARHNPISKVKIARLPNTSSRVKWRPRKCYQNWSVAVLSPKITKLTFSNLSKLINNRPCAALLPEAPKSLGAYDLGTTIPLLSFVTLIQNNSWSFLVFNPFRKLWVQRHRRSYLPSDHCALVLDRVTFREIDSDTTDSLRGLQTFLHAIQHKKIPCSSEFSTIYSHQSDTPSSQNSNWFFWLKVGEHSNHAAMLEICLREK